MPAYGTDKSMQVKPLTPRQSKAMQLILDGWRQSAVCEQIGISERTLRHWRALPAWEETLNVVVKQDSGDGDTLLRTNYPLAVGILRKLALTGGETVQLGAARTLVEAHANLLARLDERELLIQMEKQLGELKNQVVNQQAGALNPATEQVIEAEITTISHDSAHEEVVITEEIK